MKYLLSEPNKVKCELFFRLFTSDYGKYKVTVEELYALYDDVVVNKHQLLSETEFLKMILNSDTTIKQNIK